MMQIQEFIDVIVRFKHNGELRKWEVFPMEENIYLLHHTGKNKPEKNGWYLYDYKNRKLLRNSNDEKSSWRPVPEYKINSDKYCWNCGGYFIKGTHATKSVSESVWRINEYYFCSQKCINIFTGKVKR